MNARGKSGHSSLSQVLIGDAGVGKSQVAAYVARELRDERRSNGADLDVLVWVNASKTDQIITAYAKAAKKLLLAEGASDGDADLARASNFRNWLMRTERRWLVVLDDVIDPGAVEDWWPDGNAQYGRVLATTRRNNAQFSSQGRIPIHLDLYTPEESRAFLRRRLTDTGYDHLYDAGKSDEVAEELGHLPLALGWAAGYMINNRCRMSDYLRRFRNPENGLSDVLPPDAHAERYGRHFPTALLLSLGTAREADDTGLAGPLLQLISLMDPLGHPADLWITAPALHHLRTMRTMQRRWLRPHRPAVTEEEIIAALNCLCANALITQVTHQAPIRVHALTGRAIRETIPSQNRATIAHAAADAIWSLWQESSRQNRELSASLRANALHLEQCTHPDLWHPKMHACIHQVTTSFTTTGLYDQAIAYGQKILARSVETRGPDHPDTIRSQNILDHARDAASDAWQSNSKITPLQPPNPLEPGPSCHDS
ncbi:NB-ARC domain-containing protein [Streptomyces phaeofaciens]|uniref:NB-ARC domain-containing protein n=1 Tax=Streptomyces phaeofaciens TaxID=68254 RepID=UPI00367A84A5